MKKPFVFGLIAIACVLFSLLLTAASGPPAILRNVYTTNAWFFTTNADANVTNVVSVVGTNADSSLDVTLAAFKTAASNTVFLAVSNAMAQTFNTNVSATVVNTIGTNADGSITVRAQESTNRVTQGTSPWLTLGTNTIDGIADAVLAKLTNVTATISGGSGTNVSAIVTGSPNDFTTFTSAWTTNYLATNSASKLMYAECYNGSTTNWFLFTITDSNIITSGSFCRHQFWVAPTNTIVWSPPAPEAFTNGILLGISTTPSTNTFATNLVGSFTATWRP